MIKWLQRILNKSQPETPVEIPTEEPKMVRLSYTIPFGSLKSEEEWLADQGVQMSWKHSYDSSISDFPFTITLYGTEEIAILASLRHKTAVVKE